jgi:protein SCO1/2
MATSKVKQRILVFTGILVVPVFFIFLFSKARPKYSTIPYFGEHTFTASDTTYYQIPAYAFINKLGDTITQNTFEGKYLIVSVLFKTCPYQCPMPFEQFKYLFYKDLAKNKSKFDDVHILSHVVDANPSDLEKLYEVLAIDENRWTLATGDNNAIYDVNLLMKNPWQEKNPNSNFERGAYELILLIDKQRHIRGVYQSNKSSEFDRLEDELVLVMREDDKLWYKK